MIMVLKDINKGLRVSQIIKGVETTLRASAHSGLNIIFGNIGNSRETLNKAVEFLLKYEDCTQMRTIRPVTPYQGSPLYYYAIRKGLLKTVKTSMKTNTSIRTWWQSALQIW